jgi:flagellar secretion chaperone FliS
MEHGVLNSFARNASLAAYQATSVHGGVANADPHRLVQMLMDALAERLNTARGCIENGEVGRKAKLLHSCVTLVAELRGSLNLADGGELAQNLNNLYDYMTRQLLMANAQSDAALVIEVLSLLNEIRGAWVAIGPEVRKAAQPAGPAGLTPAAVQYG